jgi:alkylhydroperoxidase/carboxymuconolactone decarboxylase family protein YurZ
MAEHPLSTLKKLDPAYMEEFEKMDDLVLSDGALPRKIKLLMALAFDAAHGAGNGVAALARQSMASGATKQEIAETVRVAALLGGEGALYTASQALKGIVD